MNDSPIPDSPMTADKDAEMLASSEHEVAEHLRTRREYCRALLDLSRRQRAFIAESNYSELMSVIGRKQRVLGRLDALKQQDPALVANWKSRRAELSAAARNRCEELLHETESILADLIAEEKTCTDELTRRRDETSRQLAETSSGRRAHRAYGTPQPDEHRYLDVNQ